jgi:hypothetical protein
MYSTEDEIKRNPILCQEFRNNPTINPITRRQFQNQDEYNNFINYCNLYYGRSLLPPPALPPLSEEVLFTGNLDADRYMLMQLDFDTLVKLSTVNKNISKVINNDFWRLRLSYLYNLNSDDMNLDYIYLNKVFKKDKLSVKMIIPAILTENKNIIKIALDNGFDLVKLKELNGKMLSAMDLAITNKRYEIINLLLSSPNIPLTKKNAEDIIYLSIEEPALGFENVIKNQKIRDILLSLDLTEIALQINRIGNKIIRTKYLDLFSDAI